MTAYQQLEARFRRIGALDEAIAVLHWDAAAMMPAGGAAARAEQLATLRLLVHEVLTAPETGDLLDIAEGDAGALSAWPRANLREMRRRWRHAAALPARLVEAASRARSACEAVWREARPGGRFAAVLPAFATTLGLTREVAGEKAAAFAVSPYEALLDQYEPGLRTATIDRLFGEIARFLPELIEAASSRQDVPPAPAGPFPVAAQRQIAMRLMRHIGFDFAHGRLDVSAHPFCGGTADDVRITTRYDEDDFATALMGVLHETGHALYQRGLPAEWRRQPVGVARGMAAHESQSLLLEMQVCRSRGFFAFAAPLLREAFNGDGPGWDDEALYRRAIRVRRGLIRVDADELTYPLHIILRHRLEQALIAGDLAPADLPGAWAEGMRDLLGVVPPDDRDGCLQDIHWYDGAWGYFPTYTLGALTAAQLFGAARAALPEVSEAIAAGEFLPLLSWLRAQVHGRASLFATTEALVENVTGQALGTAAFASHLRDRYLR